VVRLIELFFPKTIDKLEKERSDLDGMIPTVVKDKDLFFLYLFGADDQKSSTNSENKTGFLKESNSDFGCNFVIIVRDEDAKLQLPEGLENAFCLTITECKVPLSVHLIMH